MFPLPTVAVVEEKREEDDEEEKEEGGGKFRLRPGWRSFALKVGVAEEKALRRSPANVKRGVAEWPKFFADSGPLPQRRFR